ncbi:MAG TPA: twin-arginine translocase subunit TatC [Candidatus Omnitrophica bacterium]|nr:MAG: twin arginine-targeting protein translocase TatC [Omnitrophica WOR_2 bacterium GWA2_45_18]HBR14423.1 twin-arginine translocase subunit TatC [Candidatus Omnitrophota bacterium]
MRKKADDLSFFEHLDELRVRLIKSLGAVIIAACFFYVFIDRTLAWVIKPVGKLVFTSPADAFMARLTLTIFGGFLLALPVVLYQIWRFVAAGLQEKEARTILIFGPASLGLFFLGGLFAYFVAVPMSMNFLLSFSSELMVPMITVKSYISFVGSFILSFGVVFELPLILMFLTKIGIATPAFLVQKRRHAIVIILIVSAILTPPDCVSQLIMAVPLMVLYEVGVLVSKLTYRR